MIPLTILSYNEEANADELVPTKGAINPEKVKYIAEVELDKKIPIVGEKDNTTKATQIVYETAPHPFVLESFEEVLALLNK